METKLFSDVELINIRELLDHKDIEDAWIAGGSMLRADSKDIDVVVLTKGHLLEEYLWDMFVSTDYRVDAVYTQYLAVDERNHTDDHSKDYVVKLFGLNGCRPIDLLIHHGHNIPKDIGEYMQKYFPMSIQCIARSMYTGKITDNSMSEANYIIIREGLDPKGTYITKYMDYYPDKVFYQQIARPVIEPVLTLKDVPF